VTDTVWPATVSAPVLEAVPDKAATLNAKVPGPDADVPPVGVIQLAEELPVQLHPLPVVTVMDPAPPAAPMVIDVAESV
jgi:hypothetical protein